MKRIIPIILIILLLFSACSKNEDEAETETPEITLEPQGDTQTDNESEPPQEEDSAALGGLSGVPVGELTNLRPYAAMINNISVALPQCGISEADIIYEVLAEGDITRMLAIFSDISNAGSLGSMRSIRPYYLELALSYDSIVVHAGGSDQAYEDIASKGVDNIDGVRGEYGANVFYRDSSRLSAGYEHALFTTAELVLEYTPIIGIRKEHSTPDYSYGLSFTENGTPESGYSAQEVDVSFSGLKHTYFTYDSNAGLYYAKQYGSDYIDGNTGEKVGFTNLIVLYAETKVLDDAGRREVTLTGSGSGHFSCGGQAVDITWSRSGNGGTFYYYTGDGSVLELGAGTTYIAIVPTGSEIIFS